jgi:sigma-B regulation protein RsbU (phosphoserine phosphatase)
VIKFASGGHLPQIFCRKNSGDFILLSSTGPVMGIIPNSDYEEHHLEDVQAGDRLILFTDGITEAKNPKTKEMFGMKRLLQSIKKHYNKNINSFKESILEDVAKFNLGGKVDDDVSLMIIEFF